VRTELATELARIDAAISTRLAASGYTAPANADLTTLLARLTEARAGYLDLLNTYLDAKISDIATLGGATAEIYTVYESDGVTPMAGCLVWATSDAAGAHEIANRGITDDLGQHTFYFDLAAGTTVYIWRRKSLKTFVNPDTEVV
jgi:hypothetical protein